MLVSGTYSFPSIGFRSGVGLDTSNSWSSVILLTFFTSSESITVPAFVLSSRLGFVITFGSVSSIYSSLVILSRLSKGTLVFSLGFSTSTLGLVFLIAISSAKLNFFSSTIG